jgi:hypothetical protein
MTVGLNRDLGNSRDLSRDGNCICGCHRSGIGDSDMHVVLVFRMLAKMFGGDGSSKTGCRVNPMFVTSPNSAAANLQLHHAHVRLRLQRFNATSRHLYNSLSSISISVFIDYERSHPGLDGLFLSSPRLATLDTFHRTNLRHPAHAIDDVTRAHSENAGLPATSSGQAEEASLPTCTHPRPRPRGRRLRREGLRERR